MDTQHHDLLATVASMYYEQDLTQSEIAEKLGISRVKVYRLLKEAKDAKVVQILIDWPIARDSRLETSLRSAFGLKDAVVLKTANLWQPPTLQKLGALGARYLEKILEASPTMAICLGQSTYEVINAIRPDLQANVQVVQAIGSAPYLMHGHDSTSLARQLAQKLGGEALYLSSPAIVDSAEAAAVIRSQSQIKRTLQAARSASVALVGIGNLDPNNSSFVKAGFMNSDELHGFIADGAVGDMAWQIYCADGQLYPCDFNHRIVGLTLDELRQIPNTVAVAMGSDKVQAILGALYTEVIDVLMTDDHTASKVLELNHNR